MPLPINPINDPADMSQTPVARRQAGEENLVEGRRAERVAPSDRGTRMQQPRNEPRPAEPEPRPAATVDIEGPPRIRDEQPETPTPQPINPTKGSINITV